MAIRPIGLGLVLAASLAASASSQQPSNPPSPAPKVVPRSPADVVARSPDRATPLAPPAAAKAPGADSLVNLVESLLVAALPTEYEKKKDWGRTKLVTTGIKFERDGLRLETRRRKEPVNDGLWKHYRVTVRPGEKLQLELENIRQLPGGRIAFQVLATAPVHGFANFMQWEHGLRLYSVSADCDATVRARLDCEAGLVLSGGLLTPTLDVDPHVSRVQLELVTFRLQRVGDLEGRLAKRLGDLSRDEIADQLRAHEPKLAEKINKSIAKHRADLRLSGDEFLKQQWEKLRDKLDAKAAAKK